MDIINSSGQEFPTHCSDSCPLEGIQDMNIKGETFLSWLTSGA